MPHKLLLADDSVTIQRVIELTFADEDVQVIAVGDGKQAINRAQQDPPDIILADVGMPERDGYEVAAFVKQSPELKHIPVLLLTGAFEPIDEGRARAAGCDGVLVKPFEPQLVINRVKDLISGRRAPAQAQPTPEPPQPEAAAAPPFPPPMPPAAEPQAPARASSPGSAPAGSIEDYFDRLDAAFSSLDTSTVLTTPATTPAPSVSDAGADAGPPPFGGLGDALAGWDPDITGDPFRGAIATPPIEINWTGSATPEAPAAHHDAPAAHTYEPPPAPPSPPPAFVAPAPPPVAAAPAFETPAPFVPPAFVPPATPPPAAPSLAEAFAALLAAEQGRPFSPAASQQAGLDERTIEDITHRVLDRMSDRVVKETVVDMAERLVREEIDRIKSARALRAEYHHRMPDGVDLSHPISVPEKPALEGLEQKWTDRWERDGVFRFDRTRDALRGLLDRYAAAHGERVAARRPRLLLHPHRRHRAVPAHARQGGLLSDGMGRQRPADRTARAELLRRPLRSVAALRAGRSRRLTSRGSSRSRSHVRTSSSCAPG